MAIQCPLGAQRRSILPLLLLLLLSAGWGQAQGYPVSIRRAEAFNTLVFGEIGYSITTRFIKKTTFHPRVFRGNPW
jgi:hypothetical protein